MRRSRYWHANAELGDRKLRGGVLDQISPSGGRKGNLTIQNVNRRPVFCTKRAAGKPTKARKNTADNFHCGKVLEARVGWDAKANSQIPHFTGNIRRKRNVWAHWGVRTSVGRRLLITTVPLKRTARGCCGKIPCRDHRSSVRLLILNPSTGVGMHVLCSGGG